MTFHMRPLLSLLSLLGALVLLPTGTAALAQDARWATRTVDATGRTEADGCAAARTQVRAGARKYQGLNIRGYTCAPVASKGDGPSAGYRCQATYEVLVRTSSN